MILIFEVWIANSPEKLTLIEFDDWREAKHDSMKRVRPGGVAFFGDSQVKLGISPLSTESKLGLPCQTLAVRGGQATSSYFLLRRMLRSGVRPHAVVIDFEPNLLARSRAENHPLWSEVADPLEIGELAWSNHDFPLFAEAMAEYSIPSVHARIAIRENISMALQGQTAPLAAHQKIFHRNESVNRGAILLARPYPQAGINVLGWSNFAKDSWQPDPINDKYARKFMRLAREHQIPVYALVMPIASELLKKEQANGMDQNYRNWLNNLQATNSNLTILDWRHSGYELSAFFDELHLNKDGAVSLGLALGDYLKNPTKGPSDRPRWIEMPPFRLDGSEVAIEDNMMSALKVQNQAQFAGNGLIEPKRIAVDGSRKTR